jgi:hypothetical protein
MSFEHFSKKKATQSNEFGKFRTNTKAIHDKKNTFEFNYSDFPEMGSVDTHIDASSNTVIKNILNTTDVVPVVSYVNILTKDIMENEEEGESYVSDTKRVFQKRRTVVHPIVNNHAISSEYKRTSYKFENDEDNYNMRDDDIYNDNEY